MTLETYAERSKRWISTACVVPRDDPMRTAEHVIPRKAAKIANEIIESQMKLARLNVQISEIQADVYKFWSQNGGAA